MIVVDRFPEVQNEVIRAFNKATLGHSYLYTVDTTGLFEAYLGGFPSAQERQFHNCNSCRRFIETYGGLVTIDATGKCQSVMWDFTPAAQEFVQPVRNMLAAVDMAAVTGVFYTREVQWGIPRNHSRKHGHDWDHFFVLPDPKFVSRDRLKTPHELRMLAQETYDMLGRAVAEFSPEVINTASMLLRSDSRARQERFMKPLQDFQQAQAILRAKSTRPEARWHFTATQPNVARIRSSVVGQLLQDLSSGVESAAALKAFMQRVDPNYYMRTQSAPKAGNLKQAEDVVQKLGLAEAVERRFARFDEVRGLAWTPKSTYEKAVGGIFAKLYPKPEAKALTKGQTMTWLKFVHEVLPGAESITYIVPAARKPYAHITACAVDGQSSLFKWGHEYSLYRWASGTLPIDFALNAGQEVTVKAIGLLPHMWDDLNSPQQGAFVYLDEGQDLEASNAGLGLHPDTLRPDLHSVRASIEHLSKAGTLKGLPGAAGLKITKGEPINIELVVTSGGLRIQYTIDRWD